MLIREVLSTYGALLRIGNEYVCSADIYCLAPFVLFTFWLSAFLFWIYINHGNVTL